MVQSGGGKTVYFHGFTFRQEFMTGWGAIAYATVSEGNEDENKEEIDEKKMSEQVCLKA